MSASRVDKVMAVDYMARRDRIGLELEDDKYPDLMLNVYINDILYMRYISIKQN